uniref:THD domain-containing protein n=1 Tax=Sphaeramia orbicularis TaxID=375764 RepID=A0A672ZXD4_9TELE
MEALYVFYRMETQSRSMKFLLLHVWCGLLTVAIVVMSAFLTSVKPKPSEVSSLSTTLSSGFLFRIKPNFLKSPVDTQAGGIWENEISCDSCSLVLRNNSIYCSEDGYYFIYAQVTFNLKTPRQDSNPLSVIIERQASMIFKGKKSKNLVEGTFPKNMDSDRASVWVGKIVRLQKTDSVRLIFKGDPIKLNTFWGAYQLR